VIDGLLMLTPLSLPFQPGPDMIQATAMAWTYVLRRHGLDDAHRDTPRVIAAFQSLMDTCYQWPAPRALLDHLPPLPRPYFHKLPAPDLTPEEVQAEAKRRRDLVQTYAAKLNIAVTP
jgi:hypothetical protein